MLSNLNLAEYKSFTYSPIRNKATFMVNLDKRTGGHDFFGPVTREEVEGLCQKFKEVLKEKGVTIKIIIGA
jgi:hypothetical protein